MYGCNRVWPVIAVSVEGLNMVYGPVRRFIGCMSVVTIMTLCLLMPAPSQSAVNVYLGSGVPVSIQADFIANATTYFNATLVPSSFFPGTYTLTVLGKNPPVQCGGTVTLPCDLDKDVASMVAVSTYSYIYGFRDGQEYERNHDLGTIGSFTMNCSSPTAFSLAQMAPAGWSLGTCIDTLGTVSSTIYNQYYSSPTIVNGYVNK